MIPVVPAPELRPDSWAFPPHRNTDAMMSRQLWLPNAFAPSLLGAAVLLLPPGQIYPPKDHTVDDGNLRHLGEEQLQSKSERFVL